MFAFFRFVSCAVLLEVVCLANHKTEQLPVDRTAGLIGVKRINHLNHNRMLCKRNGGVTTCDTSSYIEIPQGEGKQLIAECKKGNTVNVVRTWYDGSFRVINVCPANATFSNDGAHFDNGITITKNADSSYSIDGDAFTQDEGQICDVKEDCDSDACYKPETCFSEHCSGICGCKDDGDCSGINVCVVDMTMPFFAKTCGCKVGTSYGCEANSDTPVCVQSFGNGVCGCDSNADCSGADTCEGLWCIPDLPPFCATKKEHEENTAEQCNY